MSRRYQIRNDAHGIALYESESAREAMLQFAADRERVASGR